MCGIFGIVGDVRDREQIAERMNGLLRHRGPDDKGQYIDEDIYLGHRRLSIIGLESGHQPIHNEDKTVWISYNGEIYNYPELKEELEDKGHEFYTETDSEVIVHLYEELGESFVERLKGMYAISLWDADKKKLFLYRDKMGIKPLYYARMDNHFVFASELKAIVQSGLIKPEVDEDSLKEFLFYRYVPNEKTLFKGVNKILQGEIITVDSELNFDINKSEEIDPDGKEELIELIKESVRRRLMADVPLGMFLSGGIDSSTVTAMASLYTDEKIKTYSVHFDDDKESELPYANLVAEKFNTHHRPTLVSQSEMIANLPLIAWHYDEPMGDAAVVPTFLVSKVAREEVKVVLAGEGSDEQFAGYDKYKKMLEFSKKEDSSEERAKEYMKHISVFMPRHMENLMKDFDKEQFERKILEFLTPQFEEGDLLNSMLYFDQNTMLSENYLMKADKMSMANSLEERVPFLDSDIVAFSRGFSGDKKMEDGAEKLILKSAMKDVLPSEIVERKKKGYGTPTRYWFGTELGKLFGKRIYNSDFFKKYFDTDYIKNILKEHRNEEKNHNTRLWSLLVLDLWYEIYIKNNDVRTDKSYSEYFNL